MAERLPRRVREVLEDPRPLADLLGKFHNEHRSTVLAIGQASALFGDRKERELGRTILDAHREYKDSLRKIRLLENASEEIKKGYLGWAYLKAWQMVRLAKMLAVPRAGPTPLELEQLEEELAFYKPLAERFVKRAFTHRAKAKSIFNRLFEGV